MTEITTEFNSIAWQAYYGDWDGATDAPPQLWGSGQAKQEAIDDLTEKSDMLLVPLDILEAFELDMAEKGVHHDYWCDRWGEWLCEHVVAK